MRKIVLLVLFASISFSSEVISMRILATKRLHAASRFKRHYIETTGQIIAEAFLAGWMSYLMVSTAANAIEVYQREQSHIKAIQEIDKNNKKYLYNELLGIGSFNCSSAYINKEKCQNPFCCRDLNSDEKKREIFKRISDKHYFLNEIKSNIHQLNYKQKEIELLCAQGEINTEKSKKIISLIKHKKECHYQQVERFEKFKDYLDIEKVGIEGILEQLREMVEEEKKESEKEFIEKIKSISILRTKNDECDYKEFFEQQKVGQQQIKTQVNESFRTDDSSMNNFNTFMVSALVTKQMYDITNHHINSSDNSTYSSQTINTESYSSNYE